MDFSPRDFFALSSYAHRSLFEGKRYVWEALIALREYLDALLLGKANAKPLDGVFFENPEKIFIAKGAKIEKGAFLQGPCWIGENTIVRSGAYVRDYVLTGSGCVIGHGTEIKHSILLDRANAAHFNYVGDSIMGNDVNLGAGAKCANLRFDRKKITIRFEETKMETGLQKLGAILGDKAQMGCNAVANPGTIFLPGSLCSPCTNVGGVIK